MLILRYSWTIRELSNVSHISKGWAIFFGLIQYKYTSIKFPMVEIRRSYNSLISTMECPLQVRQPLNIESGPWLPHFAGHRSPPISRHVMVCYRVIISKPLISSSKILDGSVYCSKFPGLINSSRTKLKGTQVKPYANFLIYDCFYSWFHFNWWYLRGGWGVGVSG